MNIAVPPDIESALKQQARQRGQAPEDMAIDVLRERFAPDSPPADTNGTLADFLADHIGVLSSSESVSGGANMSEGCGDKFAEGMQAKRKQGRL
ncbi:MAG: hypothetical protein ACE5KM_08230 [Planctomycetaceae bacterium]